MAGHVAPTGEKRSDCMIWGKTGRKQATRKYRGRILKLILEKKDMGLWTVLSGAKTHGGLF